MTAPSTTAARDQAVDAAAAPPGKSVPRRVGSWIVAHRVDIAILLALTVFAAVTRLWRLGTVPDGLHGDEAWTGLDARRVLREGWIGPYVMSALGQPTGPLYFTAALFKLMPQTTFTLRFSMALFGIATIPVAYAAFAVMYNRTVAAFGAALLDVMMWHLHLSRTAFMVISWPFVEMLVLLTLWLAMRRRSMWLFGLAGALDGLGIYTYNAYLVFLPIPLIALLWWAVRERGWRRCGRLLLASGGGFVVCGVIVALPMLNYVRAHGQDYRAHEQMVRVTSSPRWRAAGFGGRIKIIWDRAGQWERGLVIGGRPDLGDGLATSGNPVVGPLIMFFALLGLGWSIWNWRRPEYAVLLVCVLLLPIGALATVEDGLFRRTLGLAPIFAVLAAFPLARAWEWGWTSRGRTLGTLAMALGPAIVVGVGVYTVVQYFGPLQDTATMRFVFPYQLDAASRYIDSLPKDTYIYFYSDRWSFDYETRRFLAPGYAGEDRSIEFGGALVGPEASDPVPDRSKDAAYVFLGTYLDHARDVIDRYPGGGITDAYRGTELEFTAYFLPRSIHAP